MPQRKTVKHADSDPVLFGYSSSRNVTFQSRGGGDDSCYTWGEWRAMSSAQQNEIVQEYVNDLVQVWVEEDEG